jgi:hypothetical protein
MFVHRSDFVQNLHLRNSQPAAQPHGESAIEALDTLQKSLFSDNSDVTGVIFQGQRLDFGGHTRIMLCIHILTCYV